MIGHYLRAAFAKFARSPFTTAANVLTLALGLACFIAAYGIATYWTSGDSYHPQADRIHIVGQGLYPPGEELTDELSLRSSALLAQYISEDFPEIETVARVLDFQDSAAVAGERKTSLDVALTDARLLDLFEFDFRAGDPETALDAPGSVILTEGAAARLFGDEPALGQSVLIDASWTGTVTGVIAPVRQPSFMGDTRDAVLPFELLGNWLASPRAGEISNYSQWRDQLAYTFVLIPPGMTSETLDQRLDALVDARVPAGEREVMETFVSAVPIGEVTTHRLDNLLFAQSGANLSAVSVLIGLGALTLLIACINYANLATAQIGARASEIATRKVLGAGRTQLMAQSLLESLILTSCALAVALGVLALVIPAVRSATNVELLYFLSSGLDGWIVIAGLSVVVAVVAGGYPALVLSRVSIAQSLRSGQSRARTGVIARVLVGVQFASASFLLILLTVSQLQRVELEATVLPPREDPVLILNNLAFTNVTFETLRQELLGRPGIQSVSMTNDAPWSERSLDIALARTPEAGGSAPQAHYGRVGPDYFETIGVNVLAGDVFDDDRDAPTASIFGVGSAVDAPVVIDRAYSESLGFESPAAAVGEIVYVPESIMRTRGRTAAQPVRILGVVETDAMRVGATGRQGYVYALRSGSNRVASFSPLVRISRDDIPRAVVGVTEAWDELAPNLLANIRFFDDEFDKAYRQYARVSQLFILLAGAAFIIASIGQLGIAVHAVSRRRHEIGVRKILGSTSLGVVRLLLIDFSKPALIANLLAWPLGYFAAQTYLSAFAHRIELTPAPFL
ncbi:MAG: ABC transporter permease, partial [Maricaulaceae bacterium]